MYLTVPPHHFCHLSVFLASLSAQPHCSLWMSALSICFDKDFCLFKGSSPPPSPPPPVPPRSVLPHRRFWNCLVFIFFSFFLPCNMKNLERSIDLSVYLYIYGLSSPCYYKKQASGHLHRPLCSPSNDNIYVEPV